MREGPNHDPQERHRRVADIFADALERPTEARKKFVADACGDDEALQMEVHTLLRAGPAAAHWFDAAGARRVDGTDDSAAETYAPASGGTSESTGRGPGSESRAGRSAGAHSARAADRGLEGSILSHYRLEGSLGAGGMGEVYRAWDQALGRPAAIKVLRAGVDEGLRARLLRESETHIRMEHPAIAAFLESGVVDGVEFLAMEYVQGETLRARLKRGPLPANEALSITASLLEALAYAHAAGVLHRDIKPENIMLTESGTPKLLDFGIAKKLNVEETQAVKALTATAVDAFTTDTMTALTGPGGIVGTVGYMAPEQLRAGDVKEGADVFSLGAVLYEMLAGERAFQGKTAGERIAATLSEDPKELQGDDLPTDINSVLQRALARDREERYPTAAAFLSDLRRMATGEAVAALPSTLAILDFENLAGNQQDDWLGSGVAESLGADLARAEKLRLVPRDKVLKARAALVAKRQRVDAVALGLAVGCRWVLTGAFQKLDRALRLTTRLVEVSTGKDLWTEKMDGNIDDVFSMQDRLAALTAESLRIILPQREATPPARQLDAFEYYSRGRRFWNKLERGTMEQALESFERAIEVEPTHARALAWMAATHAPGLWMNSNDPKHLELADEFARRAVAADPNLADAHVWGAYATMRMGKPLAAYEQLKKAADLDRSNHWAPYFAAVSLGLLRRWREAVAHAQRAVELEPVSPFVHMILGIALARAGQLTEARWSLEKAVELQRRGGSFGWAGAGFSLAQLLLSMNDLDEARKACMDELHFIEQSDTFGRDRGRGGGLCILGAIALAQGDLDAAKVAFEQAATHIRARPMGHLQGWSLVHALAGQTRSGGGPEPFDEALHLLESRTYDFGEDGYADLSQKSALEELAAAAWELGREKQASELLRRAVAAGDPVVEK